MTEPAHYKRGPSGAHQWLICTDSPEAQEGYPDETTDAADEGTAAHWLLEQCLSAEQNCQQWVDEQLPSYWPADEAKVAVPAGKETGCVKDWPITGEMVESVQIAIDEVNKDAKKRGTKLFVEERVRVDERYQLLDTVGGTADIIMYLPKSKTLKFYDFKYGKGHVVEVDDPHWGINPQVGLYAIGALCNLEKLLGKAVEVKKIEAGIIQPRAYHKKGVVRTKKLTPFDLMTLEMDLIEAVNGAKFRKAGDHCHFCRAKPDCEEYHAHRGEIATGGFEAETPDDGTKPEWVGVDPGDGSDATAYALVDSNNSHHHTIRTETEAPLLQTVPDLISRPVKGLNLQDLARARSILPSLKAWIKEVDEEVKVRLLNDLKVPGVKLAQGPGSRAYGGKPGEIDKAVFDSAEELGVQPFDFYEPAELKSPAQLEKHFGKTKFKSTPLAALVTYKEGGPVVVEENSDKPDYVKDGGFEAEAPPETSTESSLL